MVIYSKVRRNFCADTGWRQSRLLSKGHSRSKGVRQLPPSAKLFTGSHTRQHRETFANGGSSRSPSVGEFLQTFAIRGSSRTPSIGEFTHSITNSPTQGNFRKKREFANSLRWRKYSNFRKKRSFANSLHRRVDSQHHKLAIKGKIRKKRSFANSLRWRVDSQHHKLANEGSCGSFG